MGLAGDVGRVDVVLWFFLGYGGEESMMLS